MQDVKNGSMPFNQVKKNIYTKKRMLSIGPKFIGIFLFLFSALVTFKFFMEIIYASNYQILQIQYKDMKLGGP